LIEDGPLPDVPVEESRGRWSTAAGLTFAVLLLSVFDALALVLLPLAVLIVAFPENRRVRWFGAGAILLAIALISPGGALALLSRGWALCLAAIFLGVSLARPNWGVTSRALLATAAGIGLGLIVLVVTGRVTQLDGMIRDHFLSISTVTVGDLQAALPDSPWVQTLGAATEQISNLQADLFLALLGLQSVAALALASWWVRRLGRSESRSFALARLRDFRFNDQLIWVLIAGLVTVLLPLGDEASRLGLNALVFMGAIYALRGLAVFAFLMAAAQSVPAMVFGVLALVFLYPVAVTAALVMGVGDTWLDVRRRIVTTKPK
jgi:hypothetical protein